MATYLSMCAGKDPRSLLDYSDYMGSLRPNNVLKDMVGILCGLGGDADAKLRQDVSRRVVLASARW